MVGTSAAVEIASVLAANVTSGSCAPAWSREGKPCPNGHHLWLPFAGFTLPLELTLTNIVASLYSVLPFFAMCANVLLVVKRRRPRELLWILYALSMNLINEMLQSAFKEPRPSSSCLTSCGMPSGHSCYAVGLFVFVLLWDSVSRSIDDMETAQDHRPQSRGQFAAYLAAALLPIPWSRVHLGDHTVSQVVVGAIVGIIGAGVWLLCMGPCCEAFLEKVMRRVRSEIMSDAQTSIIAAASQREAVLDRSLLVSAPVSTMSHIPHTELSKPEDGEMPLQSSAVFS